MGRKRSDAYKPQVEAGTGKVAWTCKQADEAYLSRKWSGDWPPTAESNSLIDTDEQKKQKTPKSTKTPKPTKTPTPTPKPKPDIPDTAKEVDEYLRGKSDTYK